MPSSPEPQEKTLPPPWDRIFSLATRAFVWALLLSILYLLRPFLLLIFLTFVFAYIQAHGVEGLRHRIKNRPLRVTLVALVFLGTLLATPVPARGASRRFWENRSLRDRRRPRDQQDPELPIVSSRCWSAARHRGMREKKDEPNPDGQPHGEERSGPAPAQRRGVAPGPQPPTSRILATTLWLSASRCSATGLVLAVAVVLFPIAPTCRS
jgi:hypothetical protein